MTEHPNTILVRQMVAAFQAGNLGTVGGFFATDALWDLPGRSAVAGTYKGPPRSSASSPRPTNCRAAPSA